MTITKLANQRNLTSIVGLRVFVYFNLHKKCWSVRALEGDCKGCVVSHADVVYLRDASPKVLESGRQRVLREKQKNVHAGIIGYIVLPQDFEGDSDKSITYNPYKYKSFVYKENEEYFLNSDWCKMDSVGRVQVLVD